ncbi:family 1 glycosylhydrolase [Roseomonas xinghualingensis]|uniref:family 1 glycosylhydrolase n=1 Tax=Roseomonas xinghualingensis TaxID=2986475 RepID=UPI0021F0FAD8|nr:family 1 glycosylhydrolase [Roseomonas sp. SXEYE001]MCV4208542.1 family 1 glycosylhydrolase [Roseomonas sp. SXEYE001]
MGLQLWGGIECTVLRTQGEWRDQLKETGHHDRLTDLDLVASLGIRKLRYPVLWERVAPTDLRSPDWSWSDARLGRLRELGCDPIAGLVHHGSGPAYTSLLDPLFPEKLADYARQVAERYPWVRDWTPVNEPLTTARFSGLYGHWHPHGRDGRSFLTALTNECRGVLLAMREIRKIRPDARLIQTEDMGRVFSTPPLAEQAEHENERRWLSLDLLCGRVDSNHPWYGIMLREGVPQEHLDQLVEEARAPDVIGINHYVTSDRYLDHRVHLYPPATIGGNADGPYADVEAVRVPITPHGQTGAEARLREVWERYRLPLAITEAHLGCREPEESVRWLVEVWNGAARLRQEGVDLCAVTVWSMFGAMDWCSLLRRRDGMYEPGVFDVRHEPPRPTPLAEAVHALATTGRFEHAMVADPGWWRRDDRYIIQPEDFRLQPQEA